MDVVQTGMDELDLDFGDSSDEDFIFNKIYEISSEA